MTLYLSRIGLNPLFAPALKLAADPYELHRRLLDTLPCGPKPKPAVGRQQKTAELLFRVDATEAGPVVLLQSHAEPDWTALEMAPRGLRHPSETQPFQPRFWRGRRLAFRLLCQPVVRQSGQFGLKPNGKRKPGPRRACRDEGQRLAWLQRKGRDGGFVIETVGSTSVEWRNTKPLQTVGGDPVESYDDARRRAFGPGPAQRLGAVRFDGVLSIVDPDAFYTALGDGIGTGKAFGYGLLSVAPSE